MKEFLGNNEKKILEIWDYLRQIPEISLYENNREFGMAIDNAICDFPFEENLDIRAYPWIKKIYENLW